MALPLFVKGDFVGSIKIVQSGQDQKLTQYINEFTSKYLRRIVGQKAFDFIDTTDPLPEKYADLLNGVGYFNEAFEKTVYQDGLNLALKQLIYFEYTRDYARASQIGMVVNQPENAVQSGIEYETGKAIDKYNESSKIVDRAKIFIDNYTLREVAIDSIAGTTVNTSDTKYLQDGDTVTIQGVDYTISGLVEDTSFVVSATPPSDATKYVYNAFPLIQTSLLLRETNFCDIGTIMR